MQYANVSVAIGGDKGNLVPMYNVSVAEIAVLKAIHGDDSLVDVEPIKGVPKGADGEPIEVREPKAELQYLREKYNRAHNEDRVKFVDLVYPVAPSTKPVTSMADLDLSDEAFKPKTRARAEDAEVRGPVLPPMAPGTGHEIPKRIRRSRPGDKDLPPAVPISEAARRLETEKIGNIEASEDPKDDFLK